MIDYDRILSQKGMEIKPSGIRKFFDMALDRKDCISLGVGEPNFITPWHIRDAGIHSLEQGYTYYTPNKGLRELRVEIAKYLERRFELSYDPDNEILVTVGGSEAIDLAIRSLANPGDEVLIPEPSFVCYTPITQLAGGIPVPIKTYMEDDFQITAQSIKNAITSKTKILILPFPNNPTGSTLSEKTVRDIAKILENTNIIVISDEIYAELTYGQKHFSIANIPSMKDRVVVVSGFSKSHAMTGWRLGYATGPKEIIKVMTKIHQFAIMSAPTTAQYAAIDAMKNGDEDVEFMKGEYDKRRRLIVDGLHSIGFDCVEPHAAFYVFPSIKKFGFSSEDFCFDLLDKQNVAVVPGNAFGDSGEGFVRISYAYSNKKIITALDRIDKYINNINK